LDGMQSIQELSNRPFPIPIKQLGDTDVIGIKNGEFRWRRGILNFVG
jgi:hypothetical protein